MTGATRGIGAAIAARVAEAGARVVVVSRKAADAKKIAAGLARRYDADVRGIAADIARRADVRGLFSRLEQDGDAVHGLVNNAGHPVVERWWHTPLHKLSEKELETASRAVHDVDVDGSRWCTYYALPQMLRAKRGSIVFVSSTPAIGGYKGTPYTEAKAAVLGLMRDTAREYGPHGIRANAMALGNIRTGWLDKVPAAERRRLERENPLRRFGEPEDVANVALFLLSDLSGFVTGQTLIVDGGTLIH